MLAPSESPDADLLSRFRRSLNALKDQQIALRRQGLDELLAEVSSGRLAGQSADQFAQTILHEVLTCFSDKGEACREKAVQIVIELVQRAPLRTLLPYIISILMDRTNCHDLEGIDSVPEKMRPAPGQKPKVMAKLVEPCEQIRGEFCRLVKMIISLAEPQQVRRFVDELVNIMRTLIMDPSGEIQKSACDLLCFFCQEHRNILLHFTETLGRALLSPLVTKKSKIRMSALDALTAVFWCGLWKYNAFVFENLIGFRDPNSVPIKDFYEPSHNINYLATLINDSNSKVRLHFMKALRIWVCELDDRYDHHSKLVPYVLSGMFDSDQEVQAVAVATVEDIGHQIEVQKEKQFRENKQFAVDAAWTWEGKMVGLPVDPPLKCRPSLGSRFFVRGHVRRLWLALYKQIRDINEATCVRSANLMLLGCIYTENYLTQFLDKMLPQLISSVFPERAENEAVSKLVQRMLFLIGRYCPQSAYLHVMKSALAGEVVSNEEFVRAAMKSLSLLLSGSYQCVPLDGQLAHKTQQVAQVLKVIKSIDLPKLVYHFNAKETLELIDQFFGALANKASKQEVNTIMSEHFMTFVHLLCAALYQKEFFGCLAPGQKPEQKWDGSCLQTSLRRLFDLYPPGLDNLTEFLSECYQNPPTSLDQCWRVLSVVTPALLQAQDESLKPLGLLASEALSDCLASTESLDVLTFTFKYVRQLQGWMKNQPLQKVAPLLSSALETFTNYKCQRVIPIYDQPLAKPDQTPTRLKIAEKTYEGFFKDCSQAIRGFFVVSNGLQTQLLGCLLNSYLTMISALERFKPCQLEGVRTVWAIFQKAKLSNEFAQSFKFKGTFQLPRVIDFAVAQLQVAETPGHFKVGMVFSILEGAIGCIQRVKVELPKLPEVYPNYPELLDKLFKYALNQNDATVKQRYSSLFKHFRASIPSWFDLELRMAKESGRALKAQLISSIIQ